MNDIFNRSNQLFTGIIFDSLNKYETFTHIRSIFNDAWYNFIVPDVPPGELNWSQVQEVIRVEVSHGFQLSYYIPTRLLAKYIKYFENNGKNKDLGSDIYMFKQNKAQLTTTGELILVNDHNIEEVINIAKICFPDWANNEEYSRHMYKHQKNDTNLIVKNYLYSFDKQVVGFCGIIASLALNLAYFHGIGVLPDYRRKGHFTAIVQNLINDSIALGISDTYALVELNGGSYHGLTKLGYTPADKYYLFSTN